HIDDGLFVERIAVAVTEAVGKAASRGQRSELRIKPFAAEEEDALVFDKVHGALEAARLVRPRIPLLFFAALSIGVGAGGWFLRIRDRRRGQPRRERQCEEPERPMS